MRVLLIDDDPLVRRAVQRLLLRTHTVSTAEGGAQALALLESGHAYDAILCDFRMAGMNGDAFYAKLEAAAPSLCNRVIFVTGEAGSLDGDRFLSSKRVLRKPFDTDALDAALAALDQKLPSERAR